MSDTVWTGTLTTVFATNGNFLGGTAAAGTDTCTFDGRAVNSVAGASTGFTLSAITQYTSMSAYNIGSSSSMLATGATLVYLGVPTNDGSSATPGQVALNFGSVQNTTIVYSSASSGTSNLPPILLKGSHASNKLTVIGGTVGVAAEVPGSTATYATVNVIGPTANVLLESGCTLTTITQDDGFFHVRAAATTITQKGGTFKVTGSGAITTVNCNGTMQHQGTGTVTTLSVQDGGFADFDGINDALTITNCTVYGSGKIRDTNKRVTWTNPISFAQGANVNQLSVLAPASVAVT